MICQNVGMYPLYPRLRQALYGDTKTDDSGQARRVRPVAQLAPTLRWIPFFWIRKSFHSFFSYYVQTEFVDYIKPEFVDYIGPRSYYTQRLA